VVALSVATGLLLAPAHHGLNLRTLHLVEGRSAFPFGHVAAAYESPLDYFHLFLHFGDKINKKMAIGN
jgi:hypothetical protein